MDTQDITKTTIKSLANDFDYFLCDCDGVLWSGDKQIDQSMEVVKWL